MTIEEHLAEFGGREVISWEPGEPLPEPSEAICRIAVSWKESDEGGTWLDNFAQFLADPASHAITGLVVGSWAHVATADDETADEIAAALIAARAQLPHLEALFFGDIVREESEISWIEQGDMGLLLAAYPRLRHFGVRGGNSLQFGTLHHDHLQTLIVQSGGLAVEVVREIAAAELPALRHLELWLGTDEYGGDATVEDLAPILDGSRFPALEYLGLRDAEIADAVAETVAVAPILDRIATLDLSLGTLTDAGAAALLASPAVARLQKLDLHFHYCSEAMVARLLALPTEVDASEPQEVDEYDGEVYRYVAVGE